MATYYVDPAATGLGTGATWADAWITLQAAINKPLAAGDTVLCRGTEVLAAAVATNPNLTSGNTTTGHTKFIGCGPGGTEAEPLARQGQYVLDGSALGNNPCLLAATSVKDRITWENFTFQNAGVGGASGANSHGVRVTSACKYWNFRRCVFQGNKASGAYTHTLVRSTFYQCMFQDNASRGVENLGEGLAFLLCEFLHNTAAGVLIRSGGYNNCFVGCIFHGNGGDGATGGVNDGQNMSCFFGCVVDGNTGDGFDLTNSPGVAVIGCRITNNAGYGLNSFTAGGSLNEAIREDHNFFFNNTLGNFLDPVWSPGNSVLGTDDGYVDAAAHNFNLRRNVGGWRTDASVGPEETLLKNFWISMGLAPRDLAHGPPVR